MGEPVKEIRGDFSDVMAVTELRGSYPTVPTADGVDYAALIAGDDAPMFLTLPIGKAGVTSGNKRHYDDAFVRELERQTLQNKPVGLMGHLSESERATAFPAEAVHWVGALREGDTLWGKGYIPPGAVRDRIRRYKAQGKAIATSIDAFAEGIWDEQMKAHRMSAATLRLNQIDIAPADRAGIPDLAAVPHITTEFAPAGADLEVMEAPAKEIPQEPIVMAEKKDILQEVRKVPPLRNWAPPTGEQVTEMAAVREALGVDDSADLVTLVSELRQAQETQRKQEITSRISELVNEGVKVESVRGLVTELVNARHPQTPDEAATAYTQVMELQSVKDTLAVTVQKVMGPPQRTPMQKQHGASKYFNIPQEA